jgi:predicted Zn finger-like uncharacterized protein
METGTGRAYARCMPETYKCPHCGAVYDISYEKPVTDDRQRVDCEVCGQQMDSREGASFRHYELVAMPDGTAV